MSVISGLAGADATGDAADAAASAQIQSTQIATDAMLRMWQRAQDDFAPYLEAGYQGLTGLQNDMPQYMQQVLAPLYQETMNYNLSQLPDPYGFSVNPVTGEVSQQRSQQGYQQQGSQQLPPGTGGYRLGPKDPYGNAGQGNGLIPLPIGEGDGYRLGPKPPQNAGASDVPVSSNTGNQLFAPTSSGGERMDTPPGGDGNQMRSIPIGGQNGFVLHGSDFGGGTTGIPEFDGGSMEGGGISERFQPTDTNLLNAWSPNQQNIAVPTQDQLSQGGTLAPSVPDFQRSLEYQFNTEDPTYKIKEKLKKDEINAFLAKQNLAGSTAGQTYMQNELDKFRAEEDARQYNRARTERDYLTQTDVDKYNLLSNRGDTLYNRMQGQQDQMYNRGLSSTLTNDQRNLNLLAQRYGLGQNIYGLLYGSNLDLSKLGAGAASSAGASSITTGQNIGQNAMAAGDAAAQAYLANGQAMQGFYNNLGNMNANLVAGYLNSGNNNNSGGYGGYGYYGGGGGSNPPYYSNWEMTGDYIGD